MKVQRLVLRDIRCFSNLDLQLCGKSALIIGDNGDGKSTVMRSLAMGLCDDSSAAALFRDLHGETIRRGAKQGRITVDMRAGTTALRTDTSIISQPKRAFERVEQTVFVRPGKAGKYHEVSQQKFPWGRIFAAGYGAGIRVQGTADSGSYLTADAVYPLFRYDAPLQNPELIVRRLVDYARLKGDQRAARAVLDSIKSLLRDLLQLEAQDRLELTRTGITVKGRWGRSELSSLGDGYRSTITWVLDLLSWWFVRSSHAPRSRISTAVEGIVLIDEVEQHLHPRWQRNILRLLTTSFPSVQFIATTHSPLVASGCEDMPVHRLALGKHSVEHPFGWLAEDVYRLMGLRTSRAEAVAARLLEFEKLDLKRLYKRATHSDLARLRAIQRSLEGMPEHDPVQLITELRNMRKRLGRRSSRQGETA